MPSYKSRAEIDHRETRQIAARGGFADSALHRRNPVAGNRAAENIIDELDALAAFDRLHLDAADAELPVATGLFLVLAFGVGLAANGFAIRHLGRLQREIDVVALVELGHHDFNVLLARSCKQKFFRLRIAGETQRGIFFQDFMDGYADFVFVRARFRLDRER